LVRQRRFREDLFFRLNVVTLEIPPLRLRGDDVIELALFFLEGFCQQARRAVPRLTEAAQVALRRHAWPGNVRELRNMMERLAFLSSATLVEPRELSFLSLSGNPESKSSTELPLNMPLADATREFQIQLITHQIELAGGNMTEVAQRLGIARTNLYRKMKQLGMNEP
jgi:Nif-specific regulatory protein